MNILELIKNEPYKLGHLVGFDLLTLMHNEWIKDFVFGKEDCTYLVHRGSYKCMAPDTKVMMADYSSKSLKDIQLGDYVMGWDGTPRKVLDKYSGISPMYRVTLNKNSEYYECNNNHILTLRQRTIKHNKFHCVDKYRYEKDKNIINIPIEDFINSSASRTNGNTSETFFKHFKVGLDNIPYKDVKIPPYILGIWLGDGNSKNFALTCSDNDLEPLIEFRKFALSQGAKERVERRPKAQCATYHFSYGKVMELLNYYNLKNNKHIPDDYLYNDRKNRLELLAGLLDTDGCLGKCGHFTFTTKKEEFAKQVEWLARSLSFNAKAKPFKTFCCYKGEKFETIAWQVYINGNIDEIPTRIPRKKAKPKKNKNCHLSFSQTIEKIEDGEFIGITISGDGMFLLDNFLVVHNTVSVSIAIALLLLLRPDKTIMFMRKTDNDIAEIIKRVGSILQTDIWQAMAHELYKQEIKLKTFTQSIIDTSLNITNKGTPQLLGIGVNGSLTGKHFDIIFTDDIVNLKDRISTAEREHTKLVYQELQNVRNRGGRIINTATKWHKSDCITLMPTPTILTCYETGLITPEQLEQIRSSMTPSLFAANYELKCIADENALFTNPNILTQYNIEQLTNGIGQIDGGFGGEDFTAYTYMKYDKANNKIYACGKLWHKHVDLCLPVIKEIHEKLRGGTIHVEKNADKGYLHKNIKEFGLTSTVYNEYMNKYVKITTHLYKHWKSIYWFDTDPEYLNQILDYTEDAEHDDAPDSAASLCRKIFNGAKVITYNDIMI